MTLTLRREPIDNVLESGLEPLLEAHWQEVAHDKESIPLSVDWDGYRSDERNGSFLPLALRRDGKLIGYNAFIIGRSRHYKNHIFANNDVIYLKPEERGIDGVWMVLEAERILRALGAVKVFYHCKVDAILGSVAGDSLEAVENVLELEDRLGVKLPDRIEASTGMTLGRVLEILGYNLVENNFGKLLTGKA